MSYFNSDQLDHMKSMTATPRERKCGCGWYIKFDCFNCNHKMWEELGGIYKRDWRNHTPHAYMTGCRPNHPEYFLNDLSLIYSEMVQYLRSGNA